MNFIKPKARQIIVASSPQLAAISTGGVFAYPAVLLNQLKGNESSIILDSTTSSWVASAHGFAGIASILVPTVMQWRGRRYGFILSSLSILIGWILIYFAPNVETILAGESFHGFGANSLVLVSIVTISEMVDPKFRNVSMILLGITQYIGIVTVTLAGYFLDWRTVSILMCTPTIISLILLLIWPESPSWLAYKSQFERCEAAFVSLRGTNEDALQELNHLINARKEANLKNSMKKLTFNRILLKIKQRDFLIPNFHAFIILVAYYFSGPLVMLIYAVDIIKETTNESDFICFLYIDAMFIIGSVVVAIGTIYFKNKTILILSFIGCVMCLFFSSAAIYFKNEEVFPKETLMICILGYILSTASGNSILAFNVSTELIPVKHRGLGGALLIIETCLSHSIPLKVAPYLFVKIGMSTTLLTFALVGIVSTILIWKVIPETKDRTLQEIEDYYNIGYFGERKAIDDLMESVPISKERDNSD